MHVVYKNANNELEMVYVEILGAVIIADLLDIASNNEFNSLGHAISQCMQGFPSRFEFKVFRILLQECTLTQKHKHALFFLKQINKQTILEKYLEKHRKKQPYA
jgi:hypothetical protein